MTAAEEHCTVDSLFDGRLLCMQSRQGYRFSIDAVLLAHFIKIPARAKVLDLGAGCGVVSLILAYRGPTLRITGLELQPSLYDLFEKNIALNGYQDRIRAVPGDLKSCRQLFAAGSFDFLLSNPPYYQLQSGRTSEASEQAVARHEINATLADVVSAARYLLKVGGRAGFVYPAARLTRLLTALAAAGLEPKRLRMVHGYPGAPAKLVLVEALKNGGEELEVLPPLTIYEEKGGAYTPELAAIYAGGC